jgi:hypothetical protein
MEYMEYMNTKKGQFEPAEVGKLNEKHFTTFYSYRIAVNRQKGNQVFPEFLSNSSKPKQQSSTLFTFWSSDVIKPISN